MARKHETHDEPATSALVVYDEPTTPAIADTGNSDEYEQEAEAEIEEQIAKPASVVKAAYKVRYRDRARAAGIRGKAAKRSNWDWLAQTLAGECLNKAGKIDIDKFVAILACNGEPDALARWDNRSKGWEGRLRMTGGLWLRTEVAEAGVLRLPDGEELVPPAEWVAKILR